MTVEVGEKYLNIMIAGHNSVSAFKNKEKSKPNDPDFKGNGVAVWVNIKKAPKEQLTAVEEDVI